ncbi:MAG: FAD-binding oxidoreductase [Bacteroidota bacterium]|nr:oxidoreductase [Odoribacter sp.]MDP3645177.1 FAD-binding oxidoreductase [Bacteroidota bacterium]
MKRRKHIIQEVINLTPETFILRLDRQDFQFEPGQYVVIRIPGEQKGREYSIFSSTTDNYLDFLIREIPSGEFSRYLRHLEPGSELDVEGPKGYFILNERTKLGHPTLLIASGTGISPFHSYVKSYPDLNYRVLHGVHFADEAYGREAFKPERYFLCTSRHEKGDYFGRVTSYLKENPVQKDTICYLCGNSDMIEEVTAILEKYGLPPENIRTEVFF